jgi:SprT-like family
VTTVRAYGGTPNKRAIARDVVRWFDSTQMPLPRNVHVIVRYSDRMSATECGSASWNNTGSSVTSRSFTVIINNAMLDVEKIIETLVHEMVHVHQMVSHATGPSPAVTASTGRAPTTPGRDTCVNRGNVRPTASRLR